MFQDRGADLLLIEFVAAAARQHRISYDIRPELEVLGAAHVALDRRAEAVAGDGFADFSRALTDQRMIDRVCRTAVDQKPTFRFSAREIRPALLSSIDASGNRSPPRTSKRTRSRSDRPSHDRRSSPDHSNRLRSSDTARPADRRRAARRVPASRAPQDRRPHRALRPFPRSVRGDWPQRRQGPAQRS